MRRAAAALLVALSLLAAGQQARADAPPAVPAEEAGVFVYIRDPSAIADPAAPGEPWRIEVSVFATVDEPVPVAIDVILDPRVQLDGYAALALAPGRVACSPGGPLRCVLPVQRGQEGYLVLNVRTAPDVWPCGPLLLRADASAAGLPDATVARDRAIAGAEHCRVFPYLEGP